MEILSQQGGWFWLLAPLLAAFFAWLLYFYKKQPTENRQQHLVLAALRFLSIFVLVLLLAGFYLKTDKKIVEKPVVAVVFDNSASLLHQTDSGMLAEKLRQWSINLPQKIGKQADFRLFSFGEKLSDSLGFDFSEGATDFSRAFEQLGNRLGGQQLAAVVLVSDGIQNRGGDAVRAAEALGVPVYTLPLGDTTITRDLRIKNLRANQVVYIESDFSLLVDVEATRLGGQLVQLELEKFEKGNFIKLGSENLTLRGDNSFATANFTVPAGKAGLQKYRVSAKVAGEDPNLLNNNRREIYVEVVDTRTRILLLGNGPHPDLGFIGRALSGNPRYETTLAYAYQSPQTASKPGLVVLHQIPSLAPNSVAWMTQLKRWEVPIWYVVGTQTQIFAFNQQQSVLQISSRGGGTNKVQGVAATDFTLFASDPNLGRLLDNLPPLDAPFGEYKLGGQAQSLLIQRIGSLNTGMPLLAYSAETPRTAVLAGEGLWKWGLALAETSTANGQTLEELVRKTIQFLSVTADNAPFKVRSSKKLYEEQEEIVFDAELFNAANEAVNDPEVRLRVKHLNGQQYSFVMGRNRQYYYLNAGALPPGDYTYQAEVNLGDKKLEAKGVFAVSALDLEKINTVANHYLLAQMAALTGGKLIDIEKTDDLVLAIQTQEGMESQSYFEQRLQSLIDLEWLMALLLTLLGVEWLLRRFWGLL